MLPHGLYAPMMESWDLWNGIDVARISRVPFGNGVSFISFADISCLVSSSIPPPGLPTLSFRIRVYGLKFGFYLFVNNVSVTIAIWGDFVLR